jgi:hypothetical protein
MAIVNSDDKIESKALDSESNTNVPTDDKPTQDIPLNLGESKTSE